MIKYDNGRKVEISYIKCDVVIFLEKNALPKTIDEYFSFTDKEYDFLDKRNERIRKAAIERGL